MALRGTRGARTTQRTIQSGAGLTALSGCHCKFFGGPLPGRCRVDRWAGWPLDRFVRYALAGALSRHHDRGIAVVPGGPLPDHQRDDRFGFVLTALAVRWSVSRPRRAPPTGSPIIYVESHEEMVSLRRSKRAYEEWPGEEVRDRRCQLLVLFQGGSVGRVSSEPW